MRSVLIPIDSPAQGETAIRALVAQARYEPVGAIHLLNVQAPLTGYASRFLSRRVVRDFQRERGEHALAPGRKLLDAAALPYTVHIRLGEAASTIGQVADELRARQIVMGVDGGSWFANLSLWLLLARLRRYATVPVLVMIPPAPAPLSVGTFGSSYSR